MTYPHNNVPQSEFEQLREALERNAMAEEHEREIMSTRPIINKQRVKQKLQQSTKDHIETVQEISDILAEIKSNMPIKAYFIHYPEECYIKGIKVEYGPDGNHRAIIEIG